MTDGISVCRMLQTVRGAASSWLNEELFESKAKKTFGSFGFNIPAFNTDIFSWFPTGHSDEC